MQGSYNIQNYIITLCPSGTSFGGTGGSSTNPGSPTTTTTKAGTTTPASGGTGKCAGASYNPSTQ